MRVDAHQHFWSPARGDYGWLTPDLAPLYRDFGPADLRPELARAGIERTVLVQAAPSVHETEYMLGIADATEFVAGVVGWVDFEDPGDRRHLERLARHSKFRGVRPMIQDLPDPDWMLRPDLDWAYRALVELDLSFDALGFPRHLENFLRLFERYPALRAVVDHCAKPEIAAGRFDEWARAIERIARETPAFCKLSGLATEAGANWSPERLAPYSEHVLDVFGPARVMWGSDWPVCLLASSYQRWHDAARRLLGERPGADEVFGGTAARFYRLG